MLDLNPKIAANLDEFIYLFSLLFTYDPISKAVFSWFEILPETSLLTRVTMETSVLLIP